MNKTKMSIVNLVLGIIGMIPVVVWIWYSTGDLVVDVVIVACNGFSGVFNVGLFLFDKKNKVTEE